MSEEILEEIAKILRSKSITSTPFEDHIMLWKLDMALIISEEKLKIYEVLWPIDFEIPSFGDKLWTWRLADPSCFDMLVGFCNEEIKRIEESRKETPHAA